VGIQINGHDSARPPNSFSTLHGANKISQLQAGVAMARFQSGGVDDDEQIGFIQTLLDLVLKAQPEAQGIIHENIWRRFPEPYE